MRARMIPLLIVVFAVPALPGLAAEPPLASSPGVRTRFVTIGSECPTFSWSAVPGAGGYELEVYRLPLAEPEIGGEPLLARRIEGQTTSWTPSFEECLAGPGRYGWTVRGVVSGRPTAWSEPALFQLEQEPSEAVVRRAIEILQRYLAAQPGPDDGVAELRPSESDPADLLLGTDAVSSRILRHGAPQPGVSLPNPTSSDERLGHYVYFSYPFDDEKTWGIYSSVESDSGGAAIVGYGRVYTSATSPEPVDGVRGFSQSDTGVYGEGHIGVDGQGWAIGVKGESSLENSSSVGGSFAGSRGLVATGRSCCDGAVLADYAGQLVNRSTGENPDLLALYIDKANISPGMNFIGFFDGGGVEPNPAALIGEIEGDGLGGVRYKGSSVILTPTDTPVVCDASVTGGLYFDLTLEELCFCSGSDGWSPVDGTGTC